MGEAPFGFGARWWAEAGRKSTVECFNGFVGRNSAQHQIVVGQATTPAEVHRATPPGEPCKRSRLQDYASRVGWPTTVRVPGYAGFVRGPSPAGISFRRSLPKIFLRKYRSNRV